MYSGTQFANWIKLKQILEATWSLGQDQVPQIKQTEIVHI